MRGPDDLRIGVGGEARRQGSRARHSWGVLELGLYPRQEAVGIPVLGGRAATVDNGYAPVVLEEDQGDAALSAVADGDEVASLGGEEPLESRVLDG